MPSITNSVGHGGTNLPADVVTVQRLLNDHISELTPLKKLVEDGKVGPKTIHMIEEYQRRVLHFESPDGRVDPNGRTFKALTGTGAKLVIDVIDEADIVGWLTGLTTWDEIAVTSVQDMVSQVLARAAPYGVCSIFRLGVFGHASAGSQHLGTGGKSWSDDKVITAGNVSKRHGKTLARLKPYLRPDAIVTLHGCNVAAGKGGQILLQGLSKILGVPVQGGVEVQRPLLPGMEGEVIRCSRARCMKLGSTWLGVPE